jgi:hypothetical protein
MKQTLSMTVALSLILSASAFAASKKTCFGVAEAKGQSFTVRLTQKTAVVSKAEGELEGLEGPFERIEDTQGRNGKNYITYDLGTNDGTNHLLVEEGLLKARTKGYAKVRNRGEGFFESSYLCRDSK